MVLHFYKPIHLLSYVPILIAWNTLGAFLPRGTGLVPRGDTPVAFYLEVGGVVANEKSLGDAGPALSDGVRLPVGTRGLSIIRHSAYLPFVCL